MIDLVRITKIFRFEAAHFLYRYNGPCSNIHGHSYELHVTIGGKPKNNPGHPEDGLLMDFKQLKTIVNKSVIEKFDHALIINHSISGKDKEKYSSLDMKTYFAPFQPTCENMICHFASVIKTQLPEDVSLVSLRLYETEGSYAEWFQSDNMGWV